MNERLQMQEKSFSIFERASAQKLAQEAGRGNVIIGHRREIAEELEQAVGLGMFLTVLGHLLQQRFGLGPDDGKLEEHGRVEHRIGILLIGEYPLVLARPHAGPAADGVAGVDSAILIVADDAAQQPVVGGGNVVVGVEKDGRQGRGIDAELLLFGNQGRQFGIERVYAFHHEHIVFVHPQSLSAALAHARLEVVFGQLHLLSAEKGTELFVDERQVEGVDALVVEFSRLVFGRVMPIHELVIE